MAAVAWWAERVPPARPGRSRKDWADAGADRVAAVVGPAAAAADQAIAALPLMQQQWKKSPYKAAEIAGVQACETSSQEGFLSTLRQRFETSVISARFHGTLTDEALF